MYNRPNFQSRDQAAAIAPSDAADLPNASVYIYVGVAGDVTVLMARDRASVQFKAVPAGTVLPVAAIRVTAAGTTATNMVALY